MRESARPRGEPGLGGSAEEASGGDAPWISLTPPLCTKQVLQQEPRLHARPLRVSRSAVRAALAVPPSSPTAPSASSPHAAPSPSRASPDSPRASPALHMASSARPLVDRQRSTSRERGLLVRPSLSSSNSLSSLGPTSPISSPVGSPPALHSILKHHPAEDEDARGRGSAPRGGAAGGGTVEGSLSSLALGGVSASTSTTAVDGSERTSATGDSGARTPASASGAGGKSTQFKRRVGFDTWGAGEELADKAKATGGGTGASSFTNSAVRSRSRLTLLVPPCRRRLLVHARRQVGRLLPHSMEPHVPRRDRPQRCVPSPSSPSPPRPSTL